MNVNRNWEEPGSRYGSSVLNVPRSTLSTWQVTRLISEWWCDCNKIQCELDGLLVVKSNCVSG